VLLYHVTSYRKKIVFTNLKNAFPEKTTAEIIAIEKKFFKYFCDLVLEILKTLTISRKQMLGIANLILTQKNFLSS
jgi:KDO2-lipid IV(A) lauroyltransferase